MPTPILMPALSPTMEKGKLSKWLVKEGDEVRSGDVIAEIETDKATMEVEAVDEGLVGKIMVPEGTDDVPVNETIAVLLGDGEDASAIAETPPAAPVIAASAPPAQERPSAPAAGNGAAAQPLPAPAPTSPPQSAPATPAGERIFASPLARRIAAQNSIELSVISGSGPHGRIVKRDVEAAIAGGTAAAPRVEPTAPPAAPAPAISDEAVLKLFEEGSYEIVPHDSMRKVIAKRLTQAKSTIPHFYLSADCELDELLALRVKLNGNAPKGADGKPAYKISVNDFVIKALAVALQRVPDANVTWTEEGMLVHKTSDVGVAVAIPGGLITPVVREAHSKGLSVIANEMKDFAARARERKLLPHEYQGGTTAVSNLGMFGINNFSAVINPPHATILAVGAGQKRPVVLDDEISIRTIMTVTLSTDHRAVDGALGAELLGAFKNCIEEPAMMLV